jgi:uncharacterized membrane protein (UPF0127 family)
MRASHGALVALLVAATFGGLLGASCNGTSSAGPVARDPAPSSAPSEAPRESVVAPKRPHGDAQPTLPWGRVELEAPPRPPLSLRVEIASTDRQRELGLMFREQLGEDEGMLFLFEEERRNSFWMRNTLIPLDMLFIAADWTVIGVVENATPLTDDPRRVPGLSQYVLEVNAGFAAKHGLGAGTKVRYTPPPEGS